jgi:hypothetical protein
LYELHALIPRLGLWDTPASSSAFSDASTANLTDKRGLASVDQLERQSSIPYDYDELISSIAPRPCLLYTPTDDRDANFNDVKAAVATAAKAWDAKGAADMLVHESPEAHTKMESAESEALIKWLNGLGP